MNKQSLKLEKNPSHSKNSSSPKDDCEWRIGNYVIGKLIGKGGFANVYQATEILTNKLVAMKIVNKKRITKKQFQHLKQEIEVHKIVKHPNIATIFGFHESSTTICMIMEYVDGFELFQYINKNGALHQSMTAKIFYQIVSATNYLHNIGIVHRDIKLENIMIDKYFNAKLVDFGLSKVIKGEQDFCKTVCGSPSYKAPQMFWGKKYSGKMIDIWCLGVVLYTMLEGCLPFDQDTEEQRKKNICSYDWLTPSSSSNEAIQIYQKVFTSPELRISIEQLLSSKFLQKNNSLKTRVLEAKAVSKRANWLHLSADKRKIYIDEKQLQSNFGKKNEHDGTLRTIDSPFSSKFYENHIKNKVRKSITKPSSSRTIHQQKRLASTIKKKEKIIKTLPSINEFKPVQLATQSLKQRDKITMILKEKYKIKTQQFPPIQLSISNLAKNINIIKMKAKDYHLD